MRRYVKNSFCSYCGGPFASEQPWPRRCAQCGMTTFVNPVPVAVIVQPVGQGVLTVRRNIEPQKGALALPGGYIDLGESWQAAAARELYEELGILVEPAAVSLLNVISVPQHLLIFGLARPLQPEQLPPFTPNTEASERVIVMEPTTLAFEAHTAVLAAYFA